VLATHFTIFDNTADVYILNLQVIVLQVVSFPTKNDANFLIYDVSLLKLSVRSMCCCDEREAEKVRRNNSRAKGSQIRRTHENDVENLALS